MQPKLRIVIPFYSEFEALKPGLHALRDTNIACDVQPVQGPYVHNNRNAGVNAGRSEATFQRPLEGYTHFLFLDSDIGFMPKHVDIALKHDAPVVTLPYLRHESDGLYQVGELGPDLKIISRYGKGEKGLRSVTFAGGGFLLVRADVFGRLKFPWFHQGVMTVGDESYAVGEDVIFSHKLSLNGIPILCDFDHPVGHRIRRPEDFNVGF